MRACACACVHECTHIIIHLSNISISMDMADV